MKRALSVIKKLGIPDFVTSHPLKKPINKLMSNASAMLTNRFMPTCTARIDVLIEAVTTATPDDRSNSPPIINRATLTAITPMVALWYRTVAIAADDRKGGATIQKKMKIATAATNALSSGLVRISFNIDAACGLLGAGAAASDSTT